MLFTYFKHMAFVQLVVASLTNTLRSRIRSRPPIERFSIQSLKTFYHSGKCSITAAFRRVLLQASQLHNMFDPKLARSQQICYCVQRNVASVRKGEHALVMVRSARKRDRKRQPTAMWNGLRSTEPAGCKSSVR